MALAVHRAGVVRRRLDATFSRVVALVVQPGVEFSPDDVDVFDPRLPDELSRALAGHPSITFEAHSTDYQPDAGSPRSPDATSPC